MSINKWFGYGLDPNYDAGVREHTSGNFEEAIPFLREVVAAKNPTLHRQAHFYLAEALTQAGTRSLRREQFAEAVSYLSEAAELHPTFPDVRLQLAHALYLSGNVADAETQVAQGLALNPRYPRAIFFSGLIQFEHGDPELGLVAMQHAGTIDPLFAGDRFQAGVRNYELGDRGTALAHFNVLLQLEHNDVKSYIRLGDKFADKEQFELASAEYERALELQPTYPDVRMKYGQCLLELNQVGRAAAEFEKAIEINPNFADAHALLGVAYRRLGELDRAKKSFTAAVTINPQHLIASRELVRFR